MDGMGRFLRVLFGEDEGGSGSVFPHPAKEVNLTKHFRITYLLELGGGNSNIFYVQPENWLHASNHRVQISGTWRL